MTAAGAAVALWTRLLLVAPTDDDALLGVSAMRVERGDVPYRDYFTAATPLADYVYGLWFRIAGVSYLTFRGLTAFVIVVAAAALAVIAARLVGARWAVAAALAWVAWCSTALRIGPYYFVGLTLVLLMVVAILEGRSARAYWAYAAGVLGGCAVLAVQATLPAVGMAVIATLVSDARGRANAVRMTAGLAVVAAGFLVWLAAQSALTNFFTDAVGFVGSSYVPTQRQRFPWLPQRMPFSLESSVYLGIWPGRALKVLYWTFAFVVPLIVAVGAVAASLRASLRRRSSQTTTVGLVAAGLVVPVALFPRTPLAWVYSPLALVVAVAIVLAISGRLSRRLRLATQVALAATLAFVAAGPLVVAVLVRATPKAGDAYVRIESAGTSVYVHEQNSLAVRRVIDFAAAHPDEEIAFLPQLPALYVMTARPPPIPHVFLLPGYTPRTHLAESTEALVARRVRWVVYGRISLESLARTLPDIAARARGEQSELERFLAERYVARQRLGTIVPLGPIILYERRR